MLREKIIKRIETYLKSPTGIYLKARMDKDFYNFFIDLLVLLLTKAPELENLILNEIYFNYFGIFWGSSIKDIKDFENLPLEQKRLFIQDLDIWTHEALHVYQNVNEKDKIYLYFPPKKYIIEKYHIYPLTNIEEFFPEAEKYELIYFDREKNFYFGNFLMELNGYAFDTYISYIIQDRKKLDLHENPDNFVKSIYYLFYILKDIKENYSEDWNTIKKDEVLKEFIDCIWDFYLKVKNLLEELHDPLVSKIMREIQSISTEFY